MISSTEFTALVLVRKKAFFEWLEKANRDAMATDTDNAFEGDHGTYLAKELYTKKEVNDFLDSHYRSLFENELLQWHEKSFWPVELNRELFDDFFEVKINREVYAIEDKTQ